MARYSEIALRLLANGYVPVPIQPGTKSPNFKGWQSVVVDKPQIEKWRLNGRGRWGTGLRTDTNPGVDFDIPDKRIANPMLTWASSVIAAWNGGVKPPCRIGNAPKFLLLVRTETPFQKQKSRVFTDKAGRTYAVEILCRGQQFVADAIHPDTKRPYYWLDGRTPLDIPRNELPEILPGMIASIFREFERRCREAGLQEKRNAADDAPGASGDADDLDLDDERLGVNVEQLRDMVLRVPNDDAEYEGRGLTWFNMLCACHHELGDEAEPIAREWSEQSAKHDAAKFDKTWKSLGRYSGRKIRAAFIKRVLKELDRRPTIAVEAGEIPRMADEAEAAILAAKLPIYARGPQLVRPVMEEIEAAKGKKTWTARLVAVRTAGLIDNLSRVARWDKYDGRAKKRLSADPPGTVAAALLEREGDWKLKPIAGVTTTPTIREDGSLLLTAGYDPTTRMHLMKSLPIEPIPARLTREIALKELGRLKDLLVEWPFIDDASRSAALSMLMTPVLRGAIPVAPLHVVRAPTPGTGKSYLASLASAIAVGQVCPVIAAGKTTEETEKRLGACMMAGQPIICIDNLNGELGGDSLNQAIEQRRPQVRVLGRSEMVTIESRSTIFATGNNVVVLNDVVRRTLVVTLDTDLERPELRIFRSYPVNAVLADRAPYVRAILIIAKAWLDCGRPEERLPALASFEEWNGIVRSALIWLGETDPMKTQDRARAEDPVLNQLKAFIAAFREEIGVGPECGLTANEIIEKTNLVFDDDTPKALREVLTVFGADARRLGAWLRANAGRVIGRHKITSRRNRRNVAIWFVEGVGDL
jgi:putative DNA primase/helicase